MVHQIDNWQNDKWYKNDYFANHSICLSRARIWHDCRLFHFKELRLFWFYFPLRHACSGSCLGGQLWWVQVPKCFKIVLVIGVTLVPTSFKNVYSAPNSKILRHCMHVHINRTLCMYFPLFCMIWTNKKKTCKVVTCHIHAIWESRKIVSYVQLDLLFFRIVFYSRFGNIMFKSSA